MALFRLLLPHVCTLFMPLGAMAQQHVDTAGIEKLYGRYATIPEAPVQQPSFPGHSGSSMYSDEFDCRAGFDARATGWSETKKSWCCTHKGFDCFDCQAGRDMWSSGWSESKKAYCCPRTHGLCSSGREHGSFDCDAALSNFERAWSKAKKDHCCSHEQKGCAAHHQFDCDAALNNWKRAWSQEKKDWCCKHAGKGCQPNSFLALSPATFGIIGIILLALLALGLWLANHRAS
jgi:hypothetical protein